MFSNEKCPKHGTELVERPASLAWKGEFFPCAYCEKCNSFYELGEGWNQFMVAVKASSKSKTA